MKTAYAIRTIEDAYKVLSEESDLSPRNPAVNHTLSRLVQTLSGDYSDDDVNRILLDPRVRQMRGVMLEKLALAESEMELYWAKEFSKNTAISQDDMERFWYWENYSDLVGIESRHIPNQLYTPGESICFVGSGPLPLTAIVLNQKTGRNITCVDNNPDACEASSIFLKKAGYDKSIKVVCANGAEYNFDKHPAVLIASLVPNKNEVVRRVCETHPSSCIGLRSAERLHTLLYDPVDEEADELTSCTFSARTAYDPKIINTTLFYQGVLGTDFERNRTIKGHSRPKFGWRNTDRPILTPEPSRN